MIRITLFLFSILSFQAIGKCETVVPTTQASDIMYVVCDDLSAISVEQANQKLRKIIGQYTGDPDEIVVYFVSSIELVGIPDSELKPKDVVGIYYTHDGVLTIWPKIKSRKKEMYFKWL